MLNRSQRITAPLLAILLFVAGIPAALASNTLTWAGCGITKKAFMAELAKAYEKKTGVKIKLEGGGATRGIRDTVKHQVDMGGSCRMTLPSTDRSELYAQLNPVAWDALAVIAYKSNPISNLTGEQIKDIYAGKITNWQQLGQQDAPIHLYIRRGKISGVGYAIRQYIFKDSNKDFVTDPQYVMRSSGPLEQAIEKDPNGIAITGVSSARKRKVKILSIDGKSPSFENVRDGKYVFYRPLYLVSNSSSPAEVKNFIKFAMSKEGRAILRKNGTVPYQDAPKLMSKMLIYGFGVE
ncbi:MAG: phosphate ABC transporter substrate-binding protein [Gammaproteobacteria bacterium]|nr:phosphate ABC transporter substrate-binding protein [Gammaproteobacteria bacterium]